MAGGGMLPRHRAEIAAFAHERPMLGQHPVETLIQHRGRNWVWRKLVDAQFERAQDHRLAGVGADHDHRRGGDEFV
ncbi:MAG: hypothetical protein HPM95_13760 [Alphaproteobacteria bacterium]|nr:hypothetical protein [Alphaproteobacteria bacterium]